VAKPSRSNVARENALGLAIAHWIANLAAAGFQHSRAPAEGEGGFERFHASLSGGVLRARDRSRSGAGVCCDCRRSVFAGFAATKKAQANMILQTMTATITLTKSAVNPASSAWRVRFTATEPK